jgi:hypothetical protein
LRFAHALRISEETLPRQRHAGFVDQPHEAVFDDGVAATVFCGVELGKIRANPQGLRSGREMRWRLKRLQQ